MHMLTFTLAIIVVVLGSTEINIDCDGAAI